MALGPVLTEKKDDRNAGEASSVPRTVKDMRDYNSLRIFFHGTNFNFKAGALWLF